MFYAKGNWIRLLSIARLTVFNHIEKMGSEISFAGSF